MCCLPKNIPSFKRRQEKTYSLLDGLIGDKNYKELNDDKKAKLVDQLMSYATDTAKRDYIGEGYKSGSHEKVYEAEQAGIEPTKYFMYKDALTPFAPKVERPHNINTPRPSTRSTFPRSTSPSCGKSRRAAKATRIRLLVLLLKRICLLKIPLKSWRNTARSKRKWRITSIKVPGLGKSTVQAAYFLDWLSRQYTQAEGQQDLRSVRRLGRVSS